MQLPLDRIIDLARGYEISRFSHPCGWALHPDACRFLGTLIRECGLISALEFGSGFSSLIISDEIRLRPGHLLVSIDDSPRHSSLARENLSRHGVEANAEFHVFPLRPRVHGGQVLISYAVPRGFWDRFRGFDLVLIDGPHHDYGREAVGYEAFRALRVGGLAILDDANRPSMERKYVTKWERFFGKAVEVSHLPDVGLGLSVMRKVLSEPAGRAFGFGERVFTSLRTFRNYARVLRRGADGA